MLIPTGLPKTVTGEGMLTSAEVKLVALSEELQGPSSFERRSYCLNWYKRSQKL